MARLAEALRALGLDGQIGPSGRWVTLDGERGRVHVIEARRGGGYYSWCDAPTAQTVEHFDDAVTAILVGLRRAAQSGSSEEEQRRSDTERPGKTPAQDDR